MASANLLNLYFFFVLIALAISELHNYNGVISTPPLSDKLQKWQYGNNVNIYVALMQTITLM